MILYSYLGISRYQGMPGYNWLFGRKKKPRVLTSVDWVLKASLQSHLVNSQSSTMTLSMLLMFVCTYSGTAGKIIEYQMYIYRSKPAPEQLFPRNEYYK